MKTKIANPKKELLLGAGLNILHQESQEWLDTVAFWKHEIIFFSELLTEKETKESDYGRILKNLDKIHENLFDYLTHDIINHEKFLSRLVKGESGISDENYREQHRKLNEQMELFGQNFKDFKMMVFGYIKKL